MILIGACTLIFFFFFGDLFKSYQLGFMMCLNTAYFVEIEKLLLKVL